MLKQLVINNFTLIDKLDIKLYDGFSVITGETGAGKSIILGAISLLLGQRADPKAIKAGAQRCTIEAHFDISRYGMKQFFDDNDIDYDDNDCIIRRELTAAGKSRAFINDTPVQLTLLRELGEQLVDIHSQHQNLLLRKEDFQLNVIDIIAQDDKPIADYKAVYKQYNDLKHRIEETKNNIERSRQEENYIRFQHDEIAGAKLEAEEQDELEQESNKLSHAEEIKRGLYAASQSLDNDENGAVQLMKTALNAIRNIENVYPVIKETADRLENNYIDIKDIADDIASKIEDVDFNPERQQEVDDRLDTIYSLEKKHHTDNIAELLKIAEDLKHQLDILSDGDNDIQEMESKLDELHENLESKAAIITKLRNTAARKIEKIMKENLIPLGMPKVRFEVHIDKKSLGADGKDKAAFMFSANPGTPIQPLSEVASGGEIARVMLSLKAMISGAVKLPTIIFDEIDTGVSGAIAEKMAIIMQQMGNNGRQVISITHLPQIAAMGKVHYKVYKKQIGNNTETHMTMLNEQERVNEIANILSGSVVTDAAISNARELLKNNGNEK